MLDKHNSVKRSHSKWEQPSEGSFSQENTPEGRIGTHNDWFKMTNASYYMIYYKKIPKIIQRTEMEALIIAFTSIEVIFNLFRKLPFKSPRTLADARGTEHPCFCSVCCVLMASFMGSLAHRWEII